MTPHTYTTPTTMRTTLDAVFAGDITADIAPGLSLRLQRSAHCWRMTLASGDGPILHATCDRVATAVSAPSVEWVRNEAGTVVSAQWCEGEPVVGMVHP